jgi:hypothetical protein
VINIAELMLMDDDHDRLVDTVAHAIWVNKGEPEQSAEAQAADREEAIKFISEYKQTDEPVLEEAKQEKVEDFDSAVDRLRSHLV